MRRVRDLSPYIGQKIKAKILELDKNRNNVVLSRRQYLEETQSEVRETFLSQLKKGQIREGVVSSIVNFGAFVDLGGVDGLIHVSELSWKHIDHPSEVVKVGDKVTVEVLDVDLDRERISLSLKATQEDPWQRFARTHVPGQIVKGNYKYPEGFDPNTNEWIAGYEKQREEWESQYAAAHELWEEHKAFVAKELENAAASAAEDGQAPKEEKVEETSNYSSDNSSTGTLADSDQLAALRDQLLGK